MLHVPVAAWLEELSDIFEEINEIAEGMLQCNIFAVSKIKTPAWDEIRFLELDFIHSLNIKRRSNECQAKIQQLMLEQSRLEAARAVRMAMGACWSSPSLRLQLACCVVSMLN